MLVLLFCFILFFLRLYDYSPRKSSSKTKHMPQPCHNWIFTYYHSLAYQHRLFGFIGMDFDVISPICTFPLEFESLLLRSGKSRNFKVPGLSCLFYTHFRTHFIFFGDSERFQSDSMNFCILSALSFIMVSVTCPYLSMVKAVVACPRLLETVFTSTPFCSANVA